MYCWYYFAEHDDAQLSALHQFSPKQAMSRPLAPLGPDGNAGERPHWQLSGFGYEERRMDARMNADAVEPVVADTGASTSTGPMGTDDKEAWLQYDVEFRKAVETFLELDSDGSKDSDVESEKPEDVKSEVKNNVDKKSTPQEERVSKKVSATGSS